MYGHGPVVVIQQIDHTSIDEQLWTCLDCGYTVEDNRAFLHEDCKRELNGINTTFREYLEENEYPDGDQLILGQYFWQVGYTCLIQQ